MHPLQRLTCGAIGLNLKGVQFGCIPTLAVRNGLHHLGNSLMTATDVKSTLQSSPDQPTKKHPTEHKMSNVMNDEEQVDLWIEVDQLARCHGAHPIWDGNQLALQRNWYTREGIRIVRMRPNPCHFRNFRDWLGARHSQVAKWIC